MSENSMRRISLMVREDQYKSLMEQGVNVSGLVRDLIDDHLSEHKITLGVSEKTRLLYDRLVSNTGSTDADIEVFFRKSLAQLLDEKIKDIQSLQNELNQTAES